MMNKLRKSLIPGFTLFITVCTIFLSGTSAFISDDYLQVALHDRCNDDDIGCGLPAECCCKPSHNFDFRKSLNSTSSPAERTTSVPVQVLCRNISKMPPTLPTSTYSFKLLESEIKELTDGHFDATALKNLTNIYIWKNPHLTTIHNYAFDGLENLRTIILEDLPALTVIGRHAFWNLPHLDELRLKRTGLLSVPMFTGLASTTDIPLKLILEDSKITQVHSGAFTSLPGRIKIVQLSWNSHLSTIKDFAFNGSSIAQLILNNNKQLTTIQERAFYGLDKMTKLNVAGTAISILPTKDLKNLIEIDARRTPNLYRFPAAQELPSLRVASLTYTYHCCALNAYGFGRTFENEPNYKPRDLIPCDDIEDKPFQSGWGNKTLQQDPTYSDHGSDAYDLPIVYDYDWANYSIPANVHPYVDDAESVYLYHEKEDNEAYDGRASFLQRIYEQNFAEGSIDEEYEESTAAMSADSLWGWRSDKVAVPTSASEVGQTIELCYIDEHGNKIRDVYKTPVKCTPKPDAFNPCENVLGNPVLPAISWIVSALAIIGNFFVILVLTLVTCDRSSARQHNLSVQRFLVLNLAVADLCMGIYLLMVSAMDARSSGEYFKYGVEWQTGFGCRIAGFLSIFSSQLSVFTLSVISMERWYAIHFAIHLDKRMTMNCARICILVGWLISGFLAVLPLIGVNNYEKTSICLPFDVSESAGMAYVAVLLFIAIGAFFVDVICYLWMYTTVRTVSLTDGTRESMFSRRKRRSSVSSSKSGTIATTDATVAKRMAVLVFTNFACFFPISFFALTAAAGSPLISISQSKILLVVFYPLNSCCNPFLYAILTKSFRRDLLFWFTSRGYCIPLAAKLHGAQWRRNSADPGSGDKRDMCVRKRLQQCVKYVSKRKTVHIGEENGPIQSPTNQKEVKLGRSKSVPRPAKTKKNFPENKMKSNFSKHELDNNSNSFSSYHSIPNNQPAYMGMSRIFKHALMPKKADKSPGSSAGYKRGNKQKNNLFLQMKWFRPYRNNNGPIHPNTSKDTSVPRPMCSDDSSPLVEMSDSRMGCEFSVQGHEGKPSSYTYERRASKSRHSTTTIETRLTLGGCMRGSVDHEPVLQDVGASTP